MFKKYLAGCLLAVIFGCPPPAGAQGVELKANTTDNYSPSFR